MTTLGDLPQPPERFAFKPGEAVYYEPSNHSMTKPYFAQLIPATIMDNDGYGDCRIQRADKPRSTKVAASGLAYRGYCEPCMTGAIEPNGQLICPSCCQPAISMPPPDRLIVQWYPLDKWRTAMAIRRAAEHPDWSYWPTRHDYSDAIDAAYQGMLARLGLKELDYRSSEDSRGWRRDYDALERMKFYAILDHEDGFRAVYDKMRGDQSSGAQKEDERAVREWIKDLYTLPGDGPGGASQRLALPPLDIIRIADDSEPDDADDLTRWLERQFGYQPPVPVATVWKLPPWRVK